MISDELKKLILGILNLDDFDLSFDTVAFEVPGWDSLNHINLIIAIEKYYNIQFKSIEVLRLKSIGDLQSLINSKLFK